MNSGNLLIFLLPLMFSNLSGYHADRGEPTPQEHLSTAVSEQALQQPGDARELQLSQTNINYREIYVSLQGKDSGTGTQGDPLRTPEKAQLLARDFIAKGNNVKVRIGPGTYSLTQPLRFEESDSGKNPEQPTVWTSWSEQSELPVFTRSQTITEKPKRAYQSEKGWVWSVKIGQSRFLQVFFGKQKGIRARMPDQGSNLPELIQQNFPTYPTEASLLLPRGYQSWALEYANSCGKQMLETEIVLKKTWGVARHKVKAVKTVSNTKNDRLVISGPLAELELCLSKTVSECHLSSSVFYGPFYHHGSDGQHQPYYFENNPCFISQPGEWFADFKSGVMLFLPPPGFNPRTNEIIVAATTGAQDESAIIQVGKTSKVSNLLVDRLAFEINGWDQPSMNGIFMVGGGTYNERFDSDRKVVTGRLPAALELYQVKDFTVSRSRFSKLGTSGINVIKWGGTSNLIIEKNEFSNIDGTAIRIPFTRAENVVIQNNTIRDIGVTYGAGGIEVGGSSKVTIKNNTLERIANVAISISSLAGGVHSISANKIVRACSEYGDCGALYSNSTKPKPFINPPQWVAYFEKNVVFDTFGPVWSPNKAQISSSHPNAMYLDFYSEGVAVSKNIFRRSAKGFGINCAAGNAIFQNRVEGIQQKFLDRGCAGISADLPPITPDGVSTTGPYANGPDVLTAAEVQEIIDASGASK